MIYIISPYSSPIPELEEQRYQQVLAFTTELLIEDHPVFSSIVYLHEIARRHKLRSDHEHWLKFNVEFLRQATMAYLLKLPGWTESKGCALELNICRMLNIPVRNFGPDFELEQ